MMTKASFITKSFNELYDYDVKESFVIEVLTK